MRATRFDAFGRQPYKQNQFGATLERTARQRTAPSFLADYEGLPDPADPRPFWSSIPTPAMIGGDFSSFLDTSAVTGTDCSGQPTYAGRNIQQHVLPESRLQALPAFAASRIGGYSGSFPTNVFLPTTAIDPLAATLSKYWPTPNADIAGNNFLSDPHRQESRNNFDVRIDHKISDKDNAFGRFSYENQPSFIPSTVPTICWMAEDSSTGMRTILTAAWP